MIKRTYFTLSDCGIDVKKLSALFNDGEYKDILASLLISRFQNNWIIYSDISDIPSQKKIDSFCIKLKYIYDTTKERYNKLLALYKSQESKLLDKLESTSTTRFNDTPQNAGDFSAEEYTTNYTEVSNTATPDEMIKRLNNIYDLYHDLLADWVNEYRRLFGNEVNDE